MQSGAKRVIVNTGVLYGRMLLTVGVSLYATRIVLNALGSEDFGVYNLVAGIVAILSFLNNAMATATQRFLSFYQGKRDLGMQRAVFSSSASLHLFIGIILVALLEFTGLFLFDGFLNIPEERIDTARIVYHWVVLSVFFTVQTVPFTGVLISRENMLWVALVGIAEVVLKLVLAFSLLTTDWDKLAMYSAGLAVIHFLSLLLYMFYCLQKYPECRLNHIFHPDIRQMRELMSFTGWNLFGAMCGVGRTQGIAIILNLFFGAMINAAYGIANQVSGQLSFFSSSLLRAINPQIMKSEGAGDRERMLRLSMTASKFGFFLFALFAVPTIFEMDSILEFWLKDVPEYTVVFCQLALLGTLVNQLTIGLQSAIQATGQIKVYQAAVGTVILLNLPASYVLLSFGLPVWSTMAAYVIIEFAACLLRIYFLHRLANMSVRQYFKRVFMREVWPSLILVIICILLQNINIHKADFILTYLVCIPLFLINVFFWGLEQNEKTIIKSLYWKMINKFYFIQKY